MSQGVDESSGIDDPARRSFKVAPTTFTNPCTTDILIHNVLINCAQVHCRNCSHVSFSNVSVSHVGGYAVWIEGGSSDVAIQRASIRDVSGDSI